MPQVVPFIPLIAAVAGPLLANALESDPEVPSVPDPVQPPPAPEVSTADKVENSPIVDAEAASIRARKRRSEAKQKNIFNLGQTEDSSVTLTRQLLGE